MVLAARKQTAKLAGYAVGKRKFGKWKKGRSKAIFRKRLRRTFRRVAGRGGTFCDTGRTDTNAAIPRFECLDINDEETVQYTNGHAPLVELPRIIVHSPSDGDLATKSRESQQAFHASIEAQRTDTIPILASSRSTEAGYRPWVRQNPSDPFLAKKFLSAAQGERLLSGYVEIGCNRRLRRHKGLASNLPKGITRTWRRILVNSSAETKRSVEGRHLVALPSEHGDAGAKLSPGRSHEHRENTMSSSHIVFTHTHPCHEDGEDDDLYCGWWSDGEYDERKEAVPKGYKILSENV
ncbi:hypothetical protein BGZ63DRAFT_458552 [Mariannaea sp. PMI_226]|nr:hypothetical protein BGZ63DRAFT_458552 [Mariannaea sp. PMI_226]